MHSFLHVLRKQPKHSRGNPDFAEEHRRMPKHWELIVCLVIYVIVTTMTPAVSGHIIEGSVANCDREGEEIFIPGISSDPCITCQCQRKEVRCAKRTCPNNDGCHVIPFDKPKDQCCKTCKDCNYRGRNIKSGQTVTDNRDPCRTLTCQAGVLTISKRRCHVTCKNPRLLYGQCCPVCESCYNNNVLYHEGQTFPSDLDNCTTCKCHNGTISCQKDVCPVLNCPTSHQSIPADSCCPVCHGKRQVFLPPGGQCLFNNQVYEHGSDVTHDKCTQCACVHGTLHCERQTCPILDCVTEELITDPDACCPTCAVNKRRCKLYGKKYLHGRVWKQDVCTNCFCEDGISRCQAETCSNELECPNNTRLKMQEGQCCPQCIDDGALCTVFGDPHYRSFDGRNYNFQGTCDYVLAQTCDSSEINIVVRNDARLNQQYAWTKTVRIKIGGANVYFLQKNRVKVNRKRVKLPYVYKRSKFSIVSTGRSVALKTPAGIKVTWDGDSYLEVFVPPEMKERMCGLCGNYNNDKNDDFMGPSSILYLDADEFGRSWLASGKRCQDNSSISVNPRQSPCLLQPEKRLEAEGQCQDIYKPEFEPCQQIMDADSYYTSCLTDVCECPEDKYCFCESYIAFTRACAQEGLDLHHQLPRICKAIDCPKGAFWSDCASPCPRTCENLDDVTCEGPCRAGCECPPDKVLHDNKCIRPGRCENSNSIPGSKKKNRRKKKKRKRKKLPLDYLDES